jgi:hypothetical protein
LLVGDVRGDVAGDAVAMGASALASGLRVFVKRDPGCVFASAGLVDLEFDFSVDVGEFSFGLAVRGRKT